MPDELLSKPPEGIIEMMKIKGIGPKNFYDMERNECRKYWRTFMYLYWLIIKKLLMHGQHAIEQFSNTRYGILVA